MGSTIAEAEKNHQSYQRYLSELLSAELEEREKNLIERRIREAKIPRMKTLDEFDFSQSSKISARQIRELAEGGYLERSEPIIFIGDCGTGKTHLATGLAVAACQQKKRVRFITTAALVNELVEASHHSLLGKALTKWANYELIVLDEFGYVPLAEIGAELLFQVIADRAEKTALIITKSVHMRMEQSSSARKLLTSKVNHSPSNRRIKVNMRKAIEPGSIKL